MNIEIPVRKKWVLGKTSGGSFAFWCRIILRPFNFCFEHTVAKHPEKQQKRWSISPVYADINWYWIFFARTTLATSGFYDTFFQPVPHHSRQRCTRENAGSWKPGANLGVASPRHNFLRDRSLPQTSRHGSPLSTQLCSDALNSTRTNQTHST